MFGVKKSISPRVEDILEQQLYTISAFAVHSNQSFVDLDSCAEIFVAEQAVVEESLEVTADTSSVAVAAIVFEVVLNIVAAQALLL